MPARRFLKQDMYIKRIIAFHMASIVMLWIFAMYISTRDLPDALF
jgi:hypothetical protein